MDVQTGGRPSQRDARPPRHVLEHIVVARGTASGPTDADPALPVRKQAAARTRPAPACIGAKEITAESSPSRHPTHPIPRGLGAEGITAKSRRLNVLAPLAPGRHIHRRIKTGPSPHAGGPAEFTAESRAKDATAGPRPEQTRRPTDPRRSQHTQLSAMRAETILSSWQATAERSSSTFRLLQAGEAAVLARVAREAARSPARRTPCAQNIRGGIQCTPLFARGAAWHRSGRRPLSPL